MRKNVHSSSWAFYTLSFAKGMNVIMNGIDKITGRITTDAQKESEEIRKRADHEAQTILDSYCSMADREFAESELRNKAAAEERVERLTSVARLEARKLVLACKQEMLNLAFARALAQLVEMPEDDYVNLMSDLAVKASSTGEEEIIMSKGDRTRFGKKVIAAANEKLEKAGKAAKLSLSAETRQMQGGVYVKNGSVETNCSLETLVRIQKDKMSGEVAKLLFE